MSSKNNSKISNEINRDKLEVLEERLYDISDIVLFAFITLLKPLELKLEITSSLKPVI